MHHLTVSSQRLAAALAGQLAGSTSPPIYDNGLYSNAYAFTKAKELEQRNGKRSARETQGSDEHAGDDDCVIGTGAAGVEENPPLDTASSGGGHPSFFQFPHRDKSRGRSPSIYAQMSEWKQRREKEGCISCISQTVMMCKISQILFTILFGISLVCVVLGVILMAANPPVSVPNVVDTDCPYTRRASVNLIDLISNPEFPPPPSLSTEKNQYSQYEYDNEEDLNKWGVRKNTHGGKPTDKGNDDNGSSSGLDDGDLSSISDAFIAGAVLLVGGVLGMIISGVGLCCGSCYMCYRKEDKKPAVKKKTPAAGKLRGDQRDSVNSITLDSPLEKKSMEKP